VVQKKNAYLDHPRWLQLSPEKRATALERMEAIDAYSKLARPNTEVADKIAAELGLKRSRFFELLRTWRRTGSPIDLVPFGNPVQQERSVMPEERAERVRQVVAQAIAATPARRPKDILAAAAKLWGSAAPPAATTFRRYVDAALRNSAKAATKPHELPTEGNERARAYGEVLVVDHTAPNLFVDGPLGPQRPLLSVACDLFTGTVAGWSLALEHPTPAAVLAALQDVERRAQAGKPRTVVVPRLLISAAYGAEWRDLLATLSRAGLVVSSKITPALGYGGPSRRILGTAIGRLRLLARKAHAEDFGRSEFDANRDRVLTLDETCQLIQANIDEAAQERLTGIALHRIVLGLDTPRK